MSRYRLDRMPQYRRDLESFDAERRASAERLEGEIQRDPWNGYEYVQAGGHRWFYKIGMGVMTIFRVISTPVTLSFRVIQLWRAHPVEIEYDDNGEVRGRSPWNW